MATVAAIMLSYFKRQVDLARAAKFGTRCTSCNRLTTSSNGRRRSICLAELSLKPIGCIRPLSPKVPPWINMKTGPRIVFFRAKYRRS